MRKKIILIGGPTASGKSGLALDLARKLGGVIVNADSLQVYRDLPTLTARPSDIDEAAAPHQLYGILEAHEVCSAARWRALAMAAIDRIWQNEQVPIVTGGTGLYFKVLLEGLADVPDIPPEIRSDVRHRLEAHGPARLHEDLLATDPEMAGRLNPADRQRVARALEVKLATGKSLLWWQAQKPSGGLDQLLAPEDCLKIALAPPRDILYARTDARFRQMVEQGTALAELDNLLKRSEALTQPEVKALPVMKALGARELADYLAGECDLEAAITLAQTATRQYAKRQMTWFRNQFSDWQIFSTQYSESYFDEIFSKIRFSVLTTQ